MTNKFNPLGGNIPVNEACSQDMEFLANTIKQICNYAVNNNMNPTETIKSVANNLLLLTEISGFDNWECDNEE